MTTSQLVQGSSLPGTKLLRLLTAHHHHQIKIGTKIQHQLSLLKHLLGIRHTAFKLSQAQCLQIVKMRHYYLFTNDDNDELWIDKEMVLATLEDHAGLQGCALYKQFYGIKVTKNV